MIEGPIHVNRRQVLQGMALAGLAVTPVVGRIAFSGSLGAGATTLDKAVQRLNSLHSDPSELRDLGRAYLGTLAPRPGRAELVRALLPPRTSMQQLTEMEIEQLRNSIGSMIREDLGNGRLVVIDGWLLSETELRLSALAVLIAA